MRSPRSMGKVRRVRTNLLKAVLREAVCCVAVALMLEFHSNTLPAVGTEFCILFCRIGTDASHGYCEATKTKPRTASATTVINNRGKTASSSSLTFSLHLLAAQANMKYLMSEGPMYATVCR